MIIRYPKFLFHPPLHPFPFPNANEMKDLKCKIVSHSFFQHYELILSKLLKYASIDYVQFMLRLDDTILSNDSCISVIAV